MHSGDAIPHCTVMHRDTCAMHCSFARRHCPCSASGPCGERHRREDTALRMTRWSVPWRSTLSMWRALRSSACICVTEPTHRTNWQQQRPADGGRGAERRPLLVVHCTSLLWLILLPLPNGVARALHLLPLALLVLPLVAALSARHSREACGSPRLRRPGAETRGRFAHRAVQSLSCSRSDVGWTGA